MEKETFRKKVKELLADAYQRMVKNIDNCCDTEYKGFDSYKEDVSQMDFVNALLSLEARNHSAIGCSKDLQRKSKKRVEDYKLSIIYNRQPNNKRKGITTFALSIINLKTYEYEEIKFKTGNGETSRIRH